MIKKTFYFIYSSKSLVNQAQQINKKKCANSSLWKGERFADGRQKFRTMIQKMKLVTLEGVGCTAEMKLQLCL